MLHLLARASILRLPVPTLTFTVTVADTTPVTLGSFLIGGLVDRLYVDWGDGTVTSGDLSPQHAYAGAGAYTVKVYGARPASGLIFTDTRVAGDIADFAVLPSLAALVLDASIDGTLADVAALTDLTSFSFGSGTLTGDLEDLTARTDITALNMAGTDALTGDLSDLAGLTGLTSLSLGANGLGSTAITGDLAVATSFTALETLALEGLAIDAYSGGSFATSLLLMNVGFCDLDSTALGALVTTLHGDRVAHGSKGMTLIAYGNPGSAAVAVSHAAEISAMNAAGMNVVIN